MNKIYKVIWSKVRNCYVAVSEIAKRNGKSSGVVGGAVVGGAVVNGGAIVNCDAASICGGSRGQDSCGMRGAKANRRRGLRMSAVTLGVAAALVGGVGFGTPAAWAEPIPVDSNETVTVSDNTTADTYYYLNGSNIKFIVTETGSVGMITAATTSTDNKVGNIIQFAGTTSRSVRGGRSWGNGSVSKNTVIISGGTVGENVYGGNSNDGMAGSADADKGNKVIINGNAEIKKYIYGGSSGGTGDVCNNVVTVEPEGTVNDTTTNNGHGIWGGSSNTGAATGNEVIIKGKVLPTKRYQILGAQIYNGTADASKNKVTFDAGSSAEIGDTLQVCGAKVVSGTAKNNTVTFKAGSSVSVNQLEVYGGYADSGTANNNTITVNGATITGKATNTGTGRLQIIGGYSNGEAANTNNTVNLLGTSKIETTGEFTVSGSNETSGTGNELYIGGVKGSTETSSANIWTNTGHSVDQNIVEINGINNISNFDKIVLHDVAWNTDPKKPVLYGGTISNVNTLDITNMNIYDGDALKTTFTPGEKMTLLSSGNDISGLNLSYDASTQTTPVPLTSGVTYTTKDLVGGNANKFYKNRKTVALANENKDVTFSLSHISYTDQTDPANKAVTLYIQPSASDAEAGYTVVNEDKRLYLADGFNSLTVADGHWNTMTRLNAGYSETGDVTGKIFSITGGTISNTTPDNESEIYGGYSKSGAVTNNTVTISKTDTSVTNINGMVYGGYSSSGIAKKNIVEISGGTITKTVYGGYSQSGTAGGEVTDTDPYKNGNKVSISGGTVNYWVYGGCSNSGAARYNTIEISGGTIKNNLYGGRGATDTTGNKVTITGGTISSSQIYGGFTDLEVGITSVAATGNAVTIEGGDFTNTAIYGGSTQGHNASGNAVTISSTINNSTFGSVYGGYVDNNSGTAGDSAAGNVVTINGGKVELVYGGYIQNGVAGGVSTSDDPYENGNKVTINGGEVTTVFGGSSNNGTASNNQVSISGGKVNVWLRGGFSSQGTASKNVVTISDSAEVSGNVYGGYSGDSGAVTGNTVTISKTDTTSPTIYGQVYGGYSDSGVAGGDNANDGNKVTVTGGTINGYVWGGYSDSGAARNNTVEISGGTINSIVTGGEVYSGDGVVKGNKVTVTNSTVNNQVNGGIAMNGNAGGTGENDGNKVIISHSTIWGDVHGGVVADGTGSAVGNIVTIQDSSEVYGTVYGGRVDDGTGSAVGNIVTIQDCSTFTGDVYGGYIVVGTGSATGNTVKLENATMVTTTVFGGGSNSGSGNIVENNTLELSKTNKINTVQNFQTINIKSATWNTPALTLTGDGISQNADDSYAAVNTQNISFSGAPAVGTTTLIEGENNQLPTALKVYTGATTTETITTAGVVVKKDADPTESEANGVTLAYRNTHTVALAEDSKSITYNKANLVGTVTPGSIGWVKGGTARTLTAGDGFTFNGTTAVNAADLTFTGTINENPLNQSMTLLAGATGITGDHITPPGEGKGEVAVAYTDAKGVELNARAKGEVSVASGAVKYTINSVALDKATLGSLAWGDTDSLPESWQASATTQIDDTNFAYTGTAGTALKAGNTATILTAPGLTTGSKVTDGTVAGKTVDINYTDDAGVTYTATASGHVAAAKDAVNYVVDSVAATGVNLQSWNGTDTSTAVTTNGWNGTGVAVATGSFAAPTDLNLGETRTIATAPTGFFGTVTGSNAFPSNGGTLSEDTGGVKLAGSMIGGVKAEDEGAKLTYYAMKKTADTMTLGTFAFADGDANARTYGKEYDLTNAEITTDGLAFTEDSKKAMETGNKMTLVDASGAYKNGGAALKALSFGAKTSFAVAFTDTIEGKGLTFAGTHTDTLTQDTAKTKLIYTVGDKNVNTATLSAEIAWSDGGVHYTNGSDANQNGVKAAYKFGGDSAVDIAGVKFSTTEDPLAGTTKSMTLLKGVDGVDANKVSGTPAFTVTLDQTNTKLDATATGAAAVSGNDVTYTVSGVAIDKVNVKSVGSTADTVPVGWTLASGATIETNGMTAPTLDPGKHVDILQSNTDKFFANAKINGDNAYKPYNFTEKEGTITFAVSQSKGVTMDSKQNCLIYAAGTKDVQTATLSGEIAWSDGGVHYTNQQYTFSDASQIVFAKDAAFTATADPLNQSMTLLKGVDGVDANKVSGTPSFTVTLDQTNTKLDAKATGAAAVSGNDVTYTVSGVAIDKVNVKSVGSTADTVPVGWTLASGATIETNGMTAPTLDPGKHIDILQSNTDKFFANAKINGDNVYKSYNFTEKEGTITFTGSQSKGVTMDSKQNCLIYAAGTKDVQTATLSGEIAWSDGGVHYTNQQYTFSDASNIVFAKDAAFTATADPLNQSMTLIGADSAEHAVKGTVSGTPGFTVKMNNTSVDATVTGAATVESGNLKYTVTGVTLNKVTVDSVGSDAIPEGWSTATNVRIDTESMTVPKDAAYGQPQNIMTSDKPVFDDSNITGSNKYGENPAAFTDTDSKETPAVTIEGTQDAGVKASADKKSLVYEVGKKEATSVKLGTVTWAAGSQLLDGSNEEYDYSSVQSVDTGSFVVKYDAPQNIDVSKNESMTLLQANDTLKAIVDEEKAQAYSYTPVTGVTMDANIIGKLTNNSGAVTFTPSANKAVSLIFGDVDWLDSGALIDHKTTLANVSFDGAVVDTSKINFTNKEFMEADRQMTLVSDFGGAPRSITGSKYMVGAGFEGEGSASMEDGNLIFKTRTGAGVSEQTHKTVMAMEAGVALLNTGYEYIANVMTGLGDPTNMGEDGTSTSASIGAGGSRYETGSHVSSHTWNAAVGIGRKRELDKGTLEYGIYGEYGKSSYTLHSDAGKGDGDAHHAGGGLLAKWTNKHDVYTEASFRLGRMSDSSSNVLRDAAGNGFGYNVHANYYGAHVGVGRIFRYNGGRSLDVYGKFFYTKRNGVNFTAAGQRYDLDSVASSILRIGARYGSTDKKWNWYGGLAYEYEFDGEAAGRVNGAAVHAASIKGSSGRAEIGMRMNATKTNPWQADISLYGYAGKHRGFGGNISVAYTF